jgi:hypothetical protein
MSQKLRGEIEKKTSSFGLTSTGADWCIKALHPSDPMTEVRGIPDQSAVPTLCMNYQTTTTLSIVPGQATPWEFDFTLLPHPLYFAYWEGVKARDPATGVVGAGNFWNTQLEPSIAVPTGYDLSQAWRALAQRWRLCYMSVTIIQDGPDLANQGTIVVSQAPLEPRILTFGMTLTSQLWASYRLAAFDQAAEGPNFMRSQALPNAMMGRSRDGAYIPLKLTDTSQDWQSESDYYAPMNMGPAQPPGATVNSLIQPTMTPTYPFHDVVTAHGTNGAFHGDAIPCLMNGNVAHVSARNLSDQTSFTFHFRMGVELQLAPSSVLTPQLKLSPPFDPVALEVYFKIARELKDGYPGEYNHIGRMWDVLSNIVTRLDPFIRALPMGEVVAPAVQTVRLVGDTVRSSRKARKARKKKAVQPAQLPVAVPLSKRFEMSAADLERLRENAKVNALARRVKPARRGRRR